MKRCQVCDGQIPEELNICDDCAQTEAEMEETNA